MRVPHASESPAVILLHLGLVLCLWHLDLVRYQINSYPNHCAVLESLHLSTLTSREGAQHCVILFRPLSYHCAAGSILPIPLRRFIATKYRESLNPLLPLSLPRSRKSCTQYPEALSTDTLRLPIDPQTF